MNHRVPISIRLGISAVVVILSAIGTASAQTRAPSREDAAAAMKRAASFYRGQVALRGGYVYYYSLDLKGRLGEGVAAADQIWVQPPGTPAVGLAYLSAYEATKDSFYLDAAREAGEALIFGQLQSGAWSHSISFDAASPQAGRYRNGKGRPKGRDHSTLDDNTSQTALRMMMRLDQALNFKDAAVHESAKIALNALLAAQYPNGGLPQVWTGPVPSKPIVKANFPDYDWRTENRVKEYWNLYTLNDGLCGDVADVLIEADGIYLDPRCKQALTKLGDFLVLAQLPDPQPAWSQQYDFAMRPSWARKFEPPAVTGSESQDAIEALLKVHEQTGDPKYLEPIPRALAYLRASTLSDGRLARFYELKSNKPLYMTKEYELTYDDSAPPSHYGWKVNSRVDSLEKKLKQAQKKGSSSKPVAAKPQRLSEGERATLTRRASSVIKDLDDQGRWVSEWTGGMAVGQPKFAKGAKILSSEVFNRNLETLSAYLKDGL